MSGEWVPFSHRYGIAAPERVAAMLDSDFIPRSDFWRVRHALCFQDDTVPGVFRCTCPGSFGRQQCHVRASQEDRLCDACREHCWAVDNWDRRHRLVDLYGAVS